jgi:hypothetical protein
MVVANLLKKMDYWLNIFLALKSGLSASNSCLPKKNPIRFKANGILM